MIAAWRRRPAPTALIAVAALTGLVVRVVVMRTSIGVLDSDEAVVGLMAHHFDFGQWRAFFWGQNYGGTLETGMTAGLYRAFGMSTWALRLPPLLLSAVAALLVWRIGRRIATPRAAVIAAVIVWLWPANYLWWSIKARGFYEATLCLSLACALLLLRIGLDRRDRWTDWALLGLLAGLGWWQTPQIAIIVVPLAVWVVIVRRLRIWRAVTAVPAFILGALPWIVANLNSGFSSLTPPPAPVPSSYTDHLSFFAHNGLPMTLGLQVVYLKQWITAPIVMEIAYGAALVAVVLGVVKRRPGSVALGSVILAYPFLNSLLTLSGSVNEGRYTLFLLPWLALAMARAAEHRIARITVLVGVVAVSAIGIRSLRGQTSPYAPDIHVPTSMVSLEHSLSQHQVHYVWANYWIAYRLTFETREQVIAASAMDARYEPYQTIVSAATHPAFVFLSASRDNRAFAHRMGSSHIRYADWTVGQTWTVYIPAVRLQPTVIIASYV